MIPKLQAAGIGYVVIEPRLRLPATEAENHAFEQANHDDSRARYLQSVRLDMGHTNPTIAEVRETYVPRIDAKVPEIRATRAAVEREFGAMSGSAVSVERLISAMNNNGAISDVAVSPGGNQPPPPGNFSAAFAFFDPNGEGKPRLVISDPKDGRWNGWERYNFLRNALFAAPPERPGINAETSLNFYRAAGSGILFFTAFDPKSKRTYCFEGKQEVAAAFVPALFPASGDRDARMQVTEIIRKGRRKNG
jgi:hypothetical protein